ncbi:succinate dehydrogenase, cytochrome b556 subunit [Pseudomonas aeruginosa]
MKKLNSKRPVNLDLRTIKLPVTAYTSILHRISGVILFLGIRRAAVRARQVAEFGRRLRAGEGVPDQSPGQLSVIWGLLSRPLYHLVAGVRQLVMDAACRRDAGRRQAWLQNRHRHRGGADRSGGVWVW